MDADHGKNKEKFWKRFGGWFKPTKADAYDESIVSDSSVSTSENFDDDPSHQLIPSSTDPSAAATRSRLSRSSTGQERIEQEYNRVVGLVESIQEHMGHNAERFEMMCQSIDRLTDNLKHLPETSLSQLEVLESLREGVAAEAQRSIKVEQAVSQLPQLADAQRETMVSINRRMEESKETNEILTETLSGVRQSVEQVGQATENSANTISKMRSHDAEHQEKIVTLLQQQTNRITWMASAAIALAVIAVILGLLSLYKS